MKVITFNLRCKDDPNGNSIAERAPRLKTIMEKYDADIIGFQEVTEKWMPYLEEYYGADYEMFNRWRSQNSHESTPILWKKSMFECLDKGYFWFSSTPHLESKGDDSYGHCRICMWATLRSKIDGSEFTFINTHFGFGDKYQCESAQLILDHIRAMNVKAAIVTADFNMTKKSPAFAVMTKDLVDVNAATVKDTATTIHHYRPEKCQDIIIDFCFVSKESVIPITSHRIDDTVDGMFPSDHYGVYSEVEVKDRLSIMTYNICNNTSVLEPPADRARMVRSIVRRESPDIVCFQEVTPIWEENLAKLSAYDYELFYRGANQKEATPVFWKRDVFELVEKKNFWLSETPDVEGKGFGAHYLRICTAVVLKRITTGKCICVINTHFDFGDDCQLKEAAMLKDFAAKYGDMPVFCTADYNMTMGAPAYRSMREYFGDVRRYVAPKDFTPTFNNADGDMYAQIIIDFIFTTLPKENILSYKVIDEGFERTRPSDHNAVKAEFIL